jgi:hypothetical protein
MFKFEATATEYSNWVIKTMLDFRSLHRGVDFLRQMIAQPRYINEGHYTMSSYTRVMYATHLMIITTLHATVILKGSMHSKLNCAV